MNIQAIKGREVLDSRGNPTVEAQVQVNKHWYRAIVPSGASTGKHEAVELRDGGKRYSGKGVLNAVESVNFEIAPRLLGMNIGNQRVIDEAIIHLDETYNKHVLGANAMLAVSLACSRAAASQEGHHLFQQIAEMSKKSSYLLPVPQMNVINGGVHAGQKNDVQEHMIFPVGAKSFKEGLRMGVECYHSLKDILKKKYGSQAILVGDEGGFVPPVKTVGERLALMEKAVENAGYRMKKDVVFGLDAASSEFFDGKEYKLGVKSYTAPALLDYYKNLCTAYPIASIEDGFAEDDWGSWVNFTKEMGKKIQIVGDDLLVTNPKRIAEGISRRSCNALLLKVNQIGTVTEALDAAKLAQHNNWRVVVSHRSGETEDTFIADLAVGINAGQSKFGAPSRSDRVAKYNQLLRIEEALGKKAKYGFV
ncbi:phosphopyruvate hydratase [Candidatus Woesearchaeota archaeon]|nr:phosphopyruvate hydratase [Candidatus Woesearchaeota archaeon]